MEIFNAIGLDISQGKTIKDLVADTERNGEASLSMRSGDTVRGRCWRIGFGLEVWTTLYESAAGEIFYADCRPGFRARYRQNIKNWVLHEDRKKGEATVEGDIENGSERVFFQLQNLTEIEARNFQRSFLTVGLCGLAYRAKVLPPGREFEWRQLAEASKETQSAKNDWRLCGRINNFSALRNPFSGHDLYWIHLDLDSFQLEVLVNQDVLKGGELQIGSFIKADVWLQGHIANQPAFISYYEGVDWSVNQADFWKHLKKLN